MKTREECGKEAAEYARVEVLKHCKAVKLTPRRVLKVIAEGLDAMENVVVYDKDRGKWKTSPDLINWKARQKAVDQAISILDMKPAEKHDHAIHGEISMLLQEIDGTTLGPPSMREKK